MVVLVARVEVEANADLEADEGPILPVLTQHVVLELLVRRYANGQTRSSVEQADQYHGGADVTALALPDARIEDQARDLLNQLARVFRVRIAEPVVHACER